MFSLPSVLATHVPQAWQQRRKMPMKQAIHHPVHEEAQEAPLINFMTVGLQNLLRLQAIEFDEVPGQNSKRQATELRGQIPPFILDRYDRLRARDKKAIAVVLNSTCTACHMRQPIGKIAALMRGEKSRFATVAAVTSCWPRRWKAEPRNKRPPPAPRGES